MKKIANVSQNFALAAVTTLFVMVSGTPQSHAQDQMGYDYRNGSVDVFYFGKEDRFAAIAYSPKTGKYGYAQDCYSREIAERTALKNCDAEDARIATWVCNGFCAIAVGSDGAWGAGYSNSLKASNKSAKENALETCRENCPDAKMLLCICSIDRSPEVFDSPR